MSEWFMGSQACQLLYEVPQEVVLVTREIGKHGLSHFPY